MYVLAGTPLVCAYSDVDIFNCFILRSYKLCGYIFAQRWRPGKYNSCWKANGSHRHKKKNLMWKWSDVKLLNLVAVRLFLGPPKSPRRRMFCKQMVDFVTVRYICSHMFLWQCFVILIIRIRLVNSYLFCFSSFSKFRFWIQYQSVTLSETSAEVWNTWAATQAHSA